jgi:hypothetical protein
MENERQDAPRPDQAPPTSAWKVFIYVLILPMLVVFLAEWLINR